MKYTETKLAFLLVLAWTFITLAHSVEFTLEFDDTECFFANINKSVKLDFEYQIISGDFHDFDVFIRHEDGTAIFRSNKRERENFHWITDQSGTYSICLHSRYMRRVYFSLQLEGNDAEISTNAHGGFETTVLRLRSHLADIIDLQTYHRLREMQGRLNAEKLFTAVLKWSAGESMLLLLLAAVQVFALKTFFL